MCDARQDPEISPQSVFLAVFHSFLFRLPSFQQLEADLAEPSFQRQIGCQIVHSPVKPLLAVEWLRPGEGEDTAALRLLSQLPELYGNRF